MVAVAAMSSRHGGFHRHKMMLLMLLLQLRIGRFVANVVNVGVTIGNGKVSDYAKFAKGQFAGNRGSGLRLREKRALKRTGRVAKLASLVKGLLPLRLPKS